MIVNTLYGRLPGVVRRFIDDRRFRLGMPTMFGCIANLKRNGFTPRMIIDVGAYEGRWTENVRTIYPDSPVLMLEANPDKEHRLAQVQRRLGPGVACQRALLGASARRDVTFYSMETGSSVMPETTGVARTPIVLDMCTLDDVTSLTAIEGPILLKLDVQGYELEVLRGARQTLQLTEVLVLELSLLEYNEGAPLAAEVIHDVNALGYVLYDVCGQHRKDGSRALVQMDAVFVRSSSTLRTAQRFRQRP